MTVSNEATLTVRQDRRLIRPTSHSKRFLLARIVAPRATTERPRPPVNLAIVLDRSGSMSGDKLRVAKLAVEEAIGRLQPEDRFSVVVYDDVVDVAIESTTASAESRRGAIDRLATIQARGSTNLGEGWLRGCEQVAGHLADLGVNRCLLLTDGTAGRSIVVSAAHCAWDGADGGFARNWMFIPEFDTTPTYTCSQAKLGCWTASALVVNRGFTSAGGFNDQAVQYDWSFAVVTAPGTKGTTLDVAAGSFDLDTTTMATGSRVFDFGYPAAGKYHGSDLIYCADQVVTDPLMANRTFGIDCDMTGGSSGGPWLFPFTESTGVGTIRAVNSYGYDRIKKEYASKFNGNTANTFGAAKSATSNTIVN